MNPLDERMHAVGDVPAWSESYYFNFVDPDRRIGMFTRMGFRPGDGWADGLHAVYLGGDRVAFTYGRRDIEPDLHRYDHEVFKRLERSTDARLKYVIYKTNADFLLVSIGVFDNPGQWLAHRLPHVQMPKYRAGEPTEEASMGRGKTYYHFAWSYSQQVNRGHPGITEVLEKLSVGFDRYIRVLSHMRGEYLDLMKALSTGEIYHLERNVNKEQERQDLKKGQDAFLDSWLAWRRTGTPESLEEVRRSAAVIRALDPDFHFNEDEAAPDLPIIVAPDEQRADGTRVRQRRA